MPSVTAITDGVSHEHATMPSANFEFLVNQHKDAVYRQMLRVCGNHADAEDVLIEALLKAYRNLDQLRDAGAFRAWLAENRQPCLLATAQARGPAAPILQLSVLESEGRELSAEEPSIESQLEAGTNETADEHGHCDPARTLPRGLRDARLAECGRTRSRQEIAYLARGNEVPSSSCTSIGAAATGRCSFASP